MAASTVPDPKGGAAGSTTLSGIVIRLVLLALIDGLGIWFIVSLLGSSQGLVLAIAFAVVLVLANVVILRNELFPIRWMLVGLVLMLMFAVYPILYTINVSLTNFGFGHLLTKEQVVEQFEKNRYLPEGSGQYTWTAFVSESGDFAIWLQNDQGQNFLVKPDEPFAEVGPGEAGVGELDEDRIPLTIEGYERLNRLTVVRYIDTLGNLPFGEGDRIVQITSLDRAAELQQKYVYNADTDTLTDQETGKVYAPVEGVFTSADGEELRPGFWVYVAFENFKNFFSSSAITGPLVRIILWNFVFAFLSVLMTFALGLAIALIFNDPGLPGRKIILTLLLIPYTIPSLISIMVWRGLLNPELGIVNKTIESIFSAPFICNNIASLCGWAPPWFTNEWWAKGAILLVNLWLGYPYFMLVTSGALQAIPEDIYGAAEVDGASVWQRFWRITLPLLLVAVGPLLVASFIFNFNNFNIIFLFIEGGPPIVGAATNAGHTDILISYVYNLAFAGGRGAQYGFAAAITMVVFVLVAVMTLIQFRYTKMWEEVGENV